MFQKLKMTSVVVAIVFFLLSLLAVLQYYRFQTLLYEVNSSRISVPTQALKSDIERSLGLGLALQSNVALKSMLETTIERNTDIRSIRLADTKSATAQVPLGGRQSAAPDRIANRGRRTPPCKQGDVVRSQPQGRFRPGLVDP